MLAAVADAIGQCVEKSADGLTIAAAALDSTHMHLLIAYGGRNIDATAKWLADQTTKAVHRQTPHSGPVWGKGKWCSYVFDRQHWEHAMEYIERHNIQRGRGRRPYTFLAPPARL